MYFELRTSKAPGRWWCRHGDGHGGTTRSSSSHGWDLGKWDLAIPCFSLPFPHLFSFFCGHLIFVKSRLWYLMIWCLCHTYVLQIVVKWWASDVHLRNHYTVPQMYRRGKHGSSAGHPRSSRSWMKKNQNFNSSLIFQFLFSIFFQSQNFIHLSFTSDLWSFSWFSWNHWNHCIFSSGRPPAPLFPPLPQSQRRRGFLGALPWEWRTKSQENTSLLYQEEKKKRQSGIEYWNIMEHHQLRIAKWCWTHLVEH